MFGYDIYLADHKLRTTYWYHLDTGAQLLTVEEAQAAADWLINKYDLKDPDVRIVPKPEIREIDEASVRAAQGRTKVGSKMDRAIEVFYANPEATRKQVIALFVSELGMTPAGASTYYQTIKSNSKAAQ